MLEVLLSYSDGWEKWIDFSGEVDQMSEEVMERWPILESSRGENPRSSLFSECFVYSFLKLGVFVS